MDSEEHVIELLESKISRLEKIAYAQKKQDSQPLIESLLAANNLLTAAANKGKHIQAVYNRMPELNRLQSDGVVGNHTSEFERQLNLVLSLSNQYNLNAEVLKKVVDLHAVLDKGNLKDLDELRPELAGVLEDYAELRRQIDSVESAGQLQGSWQQITQEIIKLLAVANNSVSELENSKPSKK